MLDLHRLRLLRELSYRGTLAAVAEALSYNPSTISQQLALLEAEAGVVLLEKVGRGVRLTHAAQILVAHTEEIMRHLEQAEAEISLAKEQVVDTVRIATFGTAAHCIVLPALVTLRILHPQLRVRVTSIYAEDALPALLANDFDIVLIEQYPGHPACPRKGIQLRALCEDQMWLATGPESTTAGPSRDPLSAASDLDWVMEPVGSLAREWTMGLCRTAGFEPNVCYQSNDYYLHERFVADGHAAAILPALFAFRNGTQPASVHYSPLGQARTISTATRNGSEHRPAISATRSALDAAANDRTDSAVGARR